MTSESPELAVQLSQRARSFDAWAADYDRYRPTYPQTLFDHIAARLSLPEHAVVADLGAGTGKASRQMARRGWQVTAVEPGEAMLDVLRARAAAEGLAIEARQAPAEETGLPDASVDLVTAAQAFHWFDKARAVVEMARVTRADGGLAVFWNTLADERSDFLAGATRIMERYVPEEHVYKHDPDEEPTTRSQLAEGGLFVVDDRVEITHEITMAGEAYINYFFTASQVRLFVDEANQVNMRTDLAGLINQHFPDGKAVIPFDVELYVGRRTDKGVDQ